MIKMFCYYGLFLSDTKTRPTYQKLSAACQVVKVPGLVTNMVSVQNPLVPLCCVLGKDTLQHLPLLGGPGKQF